MANHEKHWLFRDDGNRRYGDKGKSTDSLNKAIDDTKQDIRDAFRNNKAKETTKEK